MLKRILVLCFIALLFLTPAAHAQDAEPFSPGSATQTLFADAFARGDMILANINWNLALNENADTLFAQDTEMLSALSEAIQNTTLNIGAGKIENGVRILLAGQYAKAEQSAALDITLDLTKEGILIMSSAIPGERFSAKWETLLQLCGISDAQTTELLNLRDWNLQASLIELTAQMTETLNLIGQIAAPYGETILAHIAALEQEVLTDVPAEAGFPAAATELTVLVTEKAIGGLITALANQLEADTTLCTILNAMLAESSAEITTAMLCQAARNAAAELTDESFPIGICIGMNEAGVPIYATVVEETESGGTSMISFITMPHEENPDMTQLMLDLLILPDGETLTDGFSFTAVYPKEQADPQALDLQTYFELYAEGEVLLTAELALVNSAVITEDAHAGRAGAYSLVFAVADGESVASATLTAESLQSEADEGGEQAAVAGTLEIATDDAHIPMAFETYSLTENTQEGPAATMTTFFSAPLLGIEEYMEACTLYTAAYAPEQSVISDILLETATSEEIDALLGRAMHSLKDTISILSGLLPQELTQMLVQSE